LTERKKFGVKRTALGAAPENCADAGRAIPAVAAHVAFAQATGRPAVLQRANIGQNIINRAKVLAGYGIAPGKQSWDEYPFASSRQGGQLNVSVRPVPLRENLVSTWHHRGELLLGGDQPRRLFEVVVLP